MPTCYLSWLTWGPTATQLSWHVWKYKQRCVLPSTAKQTPPPYPFRRISIYLGCGSLLVRKEGNKHHLLAKVDNGNAHPPVGASTVPTALTVVASTFTDVWRRKQSPVCICWTKWTWKSGVDYPSIGRVRLRKYVEVLVRVSQIKVFNCLCAEYKSNLWEIMTANILSSFFLRVISR